MSDELRRIQENEVRETLDERSVDDATVLGVLLAAGQSTRFGAANKLLAEIDETPLVCHAARTLLDSRVSTVVAVLGYQMDTVRDALGGFGGEFVENESYERGMATSVRAGVGVAMEMDVDAIVVLPGDMPFVNSETVDLLVDAYRVDIADAVASSYRGQRGNPVLFARQYFESLRSVSGDTGGRRVLLESNGALIEIDDAGIVSDIDTRSDLDVKT